MKKTLFYLILLLQFSNQIYAETKSFLAVENERIMQQEGDILTRYSPASTFKIALSLMGYDAGILEDETHPEWRYKKSYPMHINFWQGMHNPRTWLRDGCIGYSQVLTQTLGIEKFSEYLRKFNYGNLDVSGDKGQNNGLTQAWLSSSLEISPKEQTNFLQKLIKNQLPLTSRAHEMAKNIMYIQELPGGWKLYGKTGTGFLLDTNRQSTNLQHGWFVGWAEKNNRSIIFTNHIIDDKVQDIFAGLRAKEEAIIKLCYILSDLENDSHINKD